MRFSRPITENMSRKERYVLYFESLRRDMELKHDWQGSYDHETNWCKFLPRDDAVTYGLHFPKLFCYTARFPRGDNEVRAYMRIEDNHVLFDHLFRRRWEIDAHFDAVPVWEAPSTYKYRQVVLIRPGSIWRTENELQEIGEWHIETLLKLNEVFAPRIKRWLTRSPH